MKKLAKALCLLVLVSVSAGCATNAQTGTLTGAGVGATIGSLASQNKVLGGAIGMSAGALIGYLVGNTMDVHDLKKAHEALERQPSGVPLTWYNPDSGRERIAVTSPAQVYNGRVYRDVVVETQDGETIKMKCYRDDPTGSWVLVQES